MQLIKWDKAKQAIIEAKSVDEVKDLRDKAEAMRAYAKQAGESLEVQNNIAEIKLRAERKVGELLKETELHQHRPKEKACPEGTLNDKTKLSDLGISRKQSSRWQKIADVSDHRFEQHIETIKIANEELTTAGIIRFANKLNEETRHDDLKNRSVDLPSDVFQVIYCDPAWHYNNSGFDMSANKHYLTVPTEEMAAWKIPSIADVNSVCFMWVTNPMLSDGLFLLNSWGFEYKTNMVWVKEKHTAGFYVFGQHELLLIGVKGSMLPKEKLKSIIQGENKQHSQKPEIVYEIIEQMYPGLKSIELFARNKRKGWSSWGNEM